MYKHIRPLLPDKIGAYYEPFAGGAATWYQCHTDKHLPPPERAYLSDTNRELMNVYEQCKHHPRELMSHLERMKREHEVGLVDYFYELRDQHSELDLCDDPVGCRIAAASRFVVLNKLSFSFLYDTTADGKRCISRPSYCARGKRVAYIYNPDTLMRTHQALQTTQLRVGSFTDIQPQSGDVIYLDPPYDARQFEYGAGGAFETDMQHLVHHKAEQWRQSGCCVVVSNSDTEYIRALWAGWTITEIYKKHGIAGGSMGLHSELILHSWAHA